MDNKKILFVCEGKIAKGNWSGTTLSLYNGLKEYGFDVVPLEIVLPDFFQRVLSKTERTISDIGTKRVDFSRYPVIVNWRRRLVRKLLAGQRYDAVFAVGSLPAACLPESINKPVFQYIDGTIAVMEGYYSAKPTAAASLRYEHMYERYGLQKSIGGMIFGASDWVCESCVRDYNIPADYVTMSRIGSNNEITLTENALNAIIDARVNALLKGELNILFVGKDWNRKGGIDLLNLTKELMKRGVNNLKVCIVGCAPDIPDELKSAVTIYKQLNYDVPEDKIIFDRLYESAHFFVLPTHAECAGVVFCESSNRGLPSISYSTGGVPSIIKDGTNGYLFDMKREDAILKMAERILETTKNIEQYRNLCKTTYSFYENNLSWKKIMALICQNMFERF